MSPLSAEFAGIFQAGASVLLWLLDRALNSLEILIQPHPATPRFLSFNICAPARATLARDKYSYELKKPNGFKNKITWGQKLHHLFPFISANLDLLDLSSRGQEGLGE